VPRLVPEAYQALLAQDAPTHDRLLVAAAQELASQGIDALVLAQVSMARLMPELQARFGVPVFSALDTSLQALRNLPAPESAG